MIVKSHKIFEEAVRKGASDVFMIAGKSVAFKITGKIYTQEDQKLTNEMIFGMLEHLYDLAKRDINKLIEKGDDDFSFILPSVSRFRVNAYKQRGSYAMVVRVIRFEIPSAKVLHIPKAVMEFCQQIQGLVLVTGPAGCGKSTTLACMIDTINASREGHIITLEDPIEFTHRHQKGIVSQREIGVDTESYITGLKAALREAPNVILLGEMRDLETIGVAMTAAETGQLVFSTLHTLGVAKTIDRIIDVFPPEQQHQIRIQLAMVLRGVISQQLILTKEGIVPVFEIMFVNKAIGNLIRAGKIHQIEAMLDNLKDEGMNSMDNSLAQLCKEGKMTLEDAKNYSHHPELIERKIKLGTN